MIERIYTYDILNTCIQDILSVIKPGEDDRKKRLHAIQELADSIYSVGSLRGAAIKPFGSFMSNLYAKSGDLDVSIDLWSGSNFPTSKKKKQSVLREIMRALRNKGVAENMLLIPNARVPVLQYMSYNLGISCDLSIDNYPGRIKSRIFYWINTIDDRFADMVLLVKEWAKAQNINDPKNGTLNSYSLCLLVLFHFQTCEPAILPPLKEIYDGNVAEDAAEMIFYDEKHVDEVCAANIARFRRQNMGQRNQTSLARLLASFFRKFFTIGGLSSEVISTYMGRFERIQNNPSWMAKSYSLFIEDPFERPDNAARAVGVEELVRIGRAFEDVSYGFTGDGLVDRHEIVSLLCTPAVASILGDGARANHYTSTPSRIQLGTPVAANLYDDQHHRRARGSTGGKSVLSLPGYGTGRRMARPYQYHKHPPAYGAQQSSAGQYKNVNRPQVYNTGVQTEQPYQYHDQPRMHTRFPASGYYQNQGRSGYLPNQYAVTTAARYEAVGGRRFHDEPTWDSESSSYTAWQR
ncbi:hypothetical protein ACP70R_038638 [Stipagrostis hirtigluma subsp. patula]